MRIGRNPLSDKKLTQLTPVVLAVITHLPEQRGYHEKRFEVVKTCITSMRKRNEDLSFVVWDNGSCAMLRNWLRMQAPDIMIESVNVGKSYARAGIFGMLPPQTLIALSDDDMLFYPNWLKAQLEIFETFPNVASVTGNPIRTSFRWGCENTLAWLKDHADLETGRFISDEYEGDFCVIIGREYDYHKAYTERDVDYKAHYKGVAVYGTSHHCQFISNVGKVMSAVKRDAGAMSDEKPFDVAMDNLGLRLSTITRYSRHMGNVIHAELRKEIQELDLC